jgi:branched-chain amino acid transport system ATP-binding protein
MPDPIMDKTVDAQDGAVPVLLAATGLGKRFNALVAVDGVDMSIRPGDAVGIVGPNGAGKTTLFNLLTGAFAADSGTVLFDGVDVSGVGAAQRCRLGIARSHQVPRPFVGMTVYENLRVAAAVGGGLRGADTERVCLDALRLCGMLPLANRRAETLGLLDRKRLEMARALATRPKLLLLDEIGGGLTDGEALELVEVIQAILRRGVTIVWIEHIVHVLMRVVTRMICMDSGRVIADGEPREVMRAPAVVEAYLGSMAS